MNITANVSEISESMNVSHILEIYDLHAEVHNDTNKTNAFRPKLRGDAYVDQSEINFALPLTLSLMGWYFVSMIIWHCHVTKCRALSCLCKRKINPV